MDLQTKEKILKGAVEIGDELLSACEKDINGTSFLTMGMSNDLKIHFSKTEDIYTGVSGIALFLTELHRHTGNEKYLHCAKDAMVWVEKYCAENPTNNYAFYTGRSGVAYAFIQFYLYTGDKKYLKKALATIKDCRNFISFFPLPDDVINGISGTLLVLLHLHAATNDEAVLKDIIFFLEFLMKRARLAPAGIYWDRSGNNIKGLCGFSHGAGGIGFVYSELAHYFQNQAFYWMAEEAFAYENSLFDKSINNWPDLRKGIYTDRDYEENKNAFLKKDLKFFTKGKDFIAWCHGAPGIGLSRIRAYELTGKQEYYDQLQSAISKTISYTESLGQDSSYIQCHGGGGNADLFLEAFINSGDEKYFSLAEEVALKALASKEKKRVYQSGFWAAGWQEDNSLFMGKAGVGYFYLRMIDPAKTRSLLYPKINVAPESKRTLSPYFSDPEYPAALKKRMLQKCFGLSIAIGEKFMPEKMEDFFKNEVSENIPGKEKFIVFMNDAFAVLPTEKQKVLKDIFNLELEKNKMDDALPSHALLNTKEMINKTNAENFISDDLQLLNAELEIDENIKRTSSCWNWDLSDDTNDWINNIRKPESPEKFNILLKSTALGIEEQYLNDFSFAVFESYQNKTGTKTTDVLKNMLSSFEDLTAEDEELVKKSVVQQIRAFVDSGILCFKELLD
ncbi:MAG: lanthionine synthetase LanC family protein [Bacteroidia bacterium]